MLGRRRPLARAAVVGGTAYAVGKRRARNEMEQQYYEEPVQDTGLPDNAYDELEKLAKLKSEGILTQAEFDVQKAKILAGS